jgi:hypothetical protein
LQTLESLRRCLFWIVARIPLLSTAGFRCLELCARPSPSSSAASYSWSFQRNDGRGLWLAGGIASWKEAEEETLLREVLEETGLRVTGQKMRIRYHSKADVPCDISVFEVQATGELRIPGRDRRGG